MGVSTACYRDSFTFTIVRNVMNDMQPDKSPPEFWRKEAVRSSETSANYLTGVQNIPEDNELQHPVNTG
jgi:hypothetical protein